eukprot:216470-Chlamydomonas_euryale.AAC.1
MPEPAGGCAFAGLATFGCVIGYPCNIWMLSTAVHVTVHELMHNYGLAHANVSRGFVGCMGRCVGGGEGAESKSNRLTHSPCGPSPS